VAAVLPVRKSRSLLVSKLLSTVEDPRIDSNHQVPEHLLYFRSMISVPPYPPPAQAVASPNSASRFIIMYRRVTVILAPVQPTGWSRAMVPPLTLTFSQWEPIPVWCVPTSRCDERPGHSSATVASPT